MDYKLTEDGKLEIHGTVDIKRILQEDVNPEKILSYYEFKGEILRGMAQLFIETHGKEIVDQLKEKMLTEWVEVFKSEVLQKALQEVMQRRTY